MTEVQVALILAGIVAFAIVAAISYVRYTKKRETNDYEHDSILHPRREPGVFMPDGVEGGQDSDSSFESDLESVEPGPVHDARAESVAEVATDVQPEIRAEPLASTRAALRQRVAEFSEDDGPNPDDDIPMELVARIPGANVINRDTALGLYRQFEFDIKKPHRIFGLLHPEEKWCDMEGQPDSAQFTDFGISVQLADRYGPISESELNRFSQMVLRFAEVFGRRFKFSVSLNDALEYAHKLDAFCKKYDAVAILNVVSRNQEFRGSLIHQCAREMGLSLNERSIYEKRSPNVQGGEIVYSMASLQNNGELPLKSGGEMFTTSGITLFMNIPRSHNPAQVFNDMVADAKSICKKLDGKLVDHNLRGMTQKGLKRISQQIRQIVQEMEREGITPGSEKTLRLF